jgi:signal transduction histidine kinase
MDALGWVVAGVIGCLLFAIGIALGRNSQVVVVRGVQERAKTAEDALERQNRSAEEDRRVQDQILTTMQEGILLFDGGWRLAFANDAVDKHLGTRPAAIQQLLPVAAKDLVERVATRREAESGQVNYGSPTRWLKITATPAGTDGSVLVVVRDITESRRIEEVRRDFVANASHELKTPAASIQAAAETLHDAAQDDPAAVRKFTAQLDRDARRLSRIVADLLDLSRLETGSDLNRDVHLNEIVTDEASRFEAAAHEAGLTLVVNTERAGMIRGSERDLALLVRNLVDNAIRYTRPGGTIQVGLSSDDETVRLTVADSGLGIPTKDLPRVFERFYRVDRARSRETGGTGLGLAIVKHVAENHGGSVDVVSELGTGSTFVVTLPAARDT